MPAQIVVLLALRALQFAEDRLLGLLRQFPRHLLLRPPQDERPQRVASSRRASSPGIARQPARHLQHLRLAQHPRIQELEQAPQLADMVLHRRAAQCQPVLAAQQPDRLGATRSSRS